MRTVLILALLAVASILIKAADIPDSLSGLKPRIFDLKGTTYHVQGVDFDNRLVLVTSVDSAHRKGFLHEFSFITGELIRDIPVGDDVRFHPGGISADGASIWIPVAEYRRNSTSTIERRDQHTLNLESKFDVPDHIGCIAVTPEHLIGGNWDAKEFYVWDRDGKLIRRVASTTGNAYQDMKFESGKVVASGLLADRSGAIDWLEYPSFKLLKRIKVGNTDRGAPLTREGMAIHENQLVLLPEDGPSRLFIFQLGAK